MTWGDLLVAVIKKLAIAVAKVIGFVLWLLFSALAIIFRELQKALAKALFGDKK